MFELYGTYSTFCSRLVFMVLIEMFECAKCGSVTDDHKISCFGHGHSIVILLFIKTKATHLKPFGTMIINLLSHVGTVS